jgi:hypothetical protein
LSWASCRHSCSGLSKGDEVASPPQRRGRCRVNQMRQTETNAGPFGPAFSAHVNSREVLATRPCVRLAQPILNREVRRAVVPRLKGWIWRGVSRFVSTAATEIKPQHWSALYRRPVITPVSVAGLLLRHAPSPAVIERPTKKAPLGAGLRIRGFQIQH